MIVFETILNYASELFLEVGCGMVLYHGLAKRNFDAFLMPAGRQTITGDTP